MDSFSAQTMLKIHHMVFKLLLIVPLFLYECHFIFSLEDAGFIFATVNENVTTLSQHAALKRADPSFEMDHLNLLYFNHPFERVLDQNEQVITTTFIGDQVINITSSRDEEVSSSPTIGPSYYPTFSPTRQAREPLRVAFETFELDKLFQTSTRRSINIVKERILPRVSEIWSSILSVVPVEGSIPIKSDACYGYFDVPTNLTTNGVSNSDLVIFVSGHESINGVSLCGSNVLGSASHCVLDQYDRPIVGFINFCLDNINLNNEDTVVAVGVHELAHVLGFSDSLFQYFRSENGDPLTPRPFQKSDVDCVDGSTKNRIIASNSVLQKRNHNKLPYYEIVTPTVVSIVRNHFGCKEIDGARLENKPTAASCTGSHWDERFFFTDALSSIFSSVAVSLLSPLTVALLKDSGWYDVKFASPYIQNNPFGLGAGCEFVDEDNCIVDDKVPEKFESYFCDSVTEFTSDGKITKQSETTCDPSHNHIAYCDLFDFSTELPPWIEAMRKDNQSQFSNSNLGSTFIQADNCPIPSIFTVACSDISKVSNKLFPEEQYGADSRCFNSVLEHPSHEGITRGVCLKSYCNQRDRTLEVQIGRQIITCENEGDMHSFVSNKDVSFICPKMSSACPQMFCPAMCSGQGFCNHEANPPRCECYDEQDTSPGCYGVGASYDFYYEEPPILYPNNEAVIHEWVDPSDIISSASRLLLVFPFIAVVAAFTVI